MNSPRQITYSMFTAWLSCRQKFDYRYNRCIVPRENAVALSFGSAVHSGLETWFKTHDIDKAVEAANRIDLSDADQVKATELVRGYWEKYPHEDFTVVSIEQEFSTPLINPKTGAPSKTWELAGKVDGIIERKASSGSSNTRPPQTPTTTTSTASKSTCRSPSMPSPCSRS